MHSTLCSHCDQRWSVLHDGTLVEHPSPDNPYLLCPGSRTRARLPKEPPAPKQPAPAGPSPRRTLVSAATE